MTMTMTMTMAALLILFLAAPAVHAVQQHIVGDTSGWTQGTDYSTWATAQTFTVGDTLLFSYSGSHAVDEVNKNDYDNCNSGNALKSYSDGQTTITLDKTGPMYFTCPTIGHCQAGMKMAVNVVAASSTTPSGGGTTPVITSPPSGLPSASTSGSYSPPSTSSTTPAITTTTSSPKTTSSGAGGRFENMNDLVIGFSVVVAGLIGFMG